MLADAGVAVEQEGRWEPTPVGAGRKDGPKPGMPDQRNRRARLWVRGWHKGKYMANMIMLNG